MADTLAPPVNFVHEGFGINTLVWQTVTQSDGKILAVGFDSPNNKALLTRFNSDGTLDQSFASAGSVLLDGSYPQNTSTYFAQRADGHVIVSTTSALYDLSNSGAVLSSSSPVPYNSMLLSDGTLFKGASQGVIPLAGGGYLEFGGSGGYGGPSKPTLVKLNSDGAPDLNFGQAGTVTINSTYTDLSATSAIVQADGKIVVLARHFTDFGVVLFRVNANGTLDTSFGNQGIVADSATAKDYGFGLTLQPDGKILVGGANPGHATLIRYTADGHLDPTFGTNGISTLLDTCSNVYGVGTQVNVLSNGKILLSGAMQVNSFTGGPLLTNSLFSAQFNADGSLDTSSFGTPYYDIVGTSGNDTFDPDGSTHYINGLAGDDTLIERLSASDFTLTQRATDWLLTSKINPGYQISLTNIEHIKFNANAVTNGVSMATIVDLQSSSSGQSSTATFLQDKYHISMDAARGWVIGHLDTPQVIHDICASAGVTSAMLADIVQPALPELTITGTLVNQWFANHGVAGLA